MSDNVRQIQFINDEENCEDADLNNDNRSLKATHSRLPISNDNEKHTKQQQFKINVPTIIIFARDAYFTASKVNNTEILRAWSKLQNYFVIENEHKLCGPLVIIITKGHFKYTAF